MAPGSSEGFLTTYKVWMGWGGVKDAQEGEDIYILIIFKNDGTENKHNIIK